MSLHAQLSPEAQAELDAMRRNSGISSFITGILGVVLIGLVAALIGLDAVVRDQATIVAYQPPKTKPQDIETTRMPTKIQPNPSAPSSSRARVIFANTNSVTAVPVPETDIAEPSPDFGSGDDFGDGWDTAEGPGGFQSIPPIMRKRCSPEDRLQRLLENGGTERCEDAVVKGLDWLQKTQAPDGSWGAANKPAMTGFALLAYLGHCETPASGKYSDTVLRGLTFLIDLGMRNNGKLVPPGGEKEKHWPYQHAIATYALAEAATFCKQLGVNVPDLQQVTQQAGQYIIDNQHKSGGWDYSYDEAGERGGDLSIAAWQIQALKACHHTGLDFRNMRSCIAKALDYVSERQDASGGYGYQGKGPAGDTGGYHTLTGAGMLCMQMWDKGSHSGVRNGARYIEKNSKFDYNTEFCDLYGHYYEGQAMMNRGGDQWKAYNALFRDQLLNNQAPDGSWMNPGGGSKPRAVAASFIGTGAESVHYRTCLAILMLEVYYRFLPGTGAATKG